MDYLQTNKTQLLGVRRPGGALACGSPTPPLLASTQITPKMTMVETGQSAARPAHSKELRIFTATFLIMIPSAPA
jgi:hypothetical protein